MSANFVPPKTVRLPMPTNPVARIVEIIKYIVSTLITIGCIVYLFYGIGKEHATLPGPPITHYILFLFVLTMLAYLEGLQVAILALEHRDVSHYRGLYDRGCGLQEICAKGKNVSRFLVGRQFFVIFCGYLAANLTTFPDFPQGGMPTWLYILLVSTGLPGALTVLSFGQLMPQLVGQCDPMFLMNLPGSWWVLQLCLVMESTGIPSIAWVVSALHMWAASLPRMPDVADVEKGGLRTRLSAVDNELVVYAADLDPTALSMNADQGMDVLTSDDIINNKASVGWEKAMKKWGYGPNSHHISPLHIACELAKNNQPIPRFLLPPENKLHIPPHIVAYELMQRNRKLIGEVEDLRSRLTPQQKIDWLVGQVDMDMLEQGHLVIA